MHKDKLSPKEWTRRLSEDSTPTAELTQYILRDSSMTTRGLRLANSVYYNPSGQPVNTISRAIPRGRNT